ncbi:MAG: DNA-binding response regulator, partial [Pedobacter sp.]
TIEGNRQNLLEKTGTKNTAALINFVVRNRIID